MKSRGGVIAGAALACMVTSAHAACPGPPFQDDCTLTAGQLNQFAPLNSPAFTGTPTLNGMPLLPQSTPQAPAVVRPGPYNACPTKLPFVDNCPPYASQLNALAPLNSPAFVGDLSINGTRIPPIDPGPRLGPADAGGSLPGLSGPEVSFFSANQSVFKEVDSVTGSLPGEGGRGLGPLFNGNSCAACHANPAVGGSSPPVNPQVALATLDGATNSLPSFVTSDGPVIQVRFLSDGLVHQIYTITGRSDAPGGCSLSQPAFTPGTYALRAPPNLFGLGLLENVTDDSLRAAQNPSMANPLGIATGIFNIASDGTIARFGLKAQQKSIDTFAGEAYNVEIGVSNEAFPTEIVSGVCEPNTTPEDLTPPAGGNSDVVSFAGFIRLLAGPTPEPGGYTTATATVTAGSIASGETLFQSTGCQFCHIPTQVTTGSPYTGQSNVTFRPFTDLALHAMGSGLADGIVQGDANGSQFRTAPLWGAGKKLFFLHDGRTTDIYQAIIAHSSSGSEANAVISAFDALPTPSQQDILNFLRSL